MHKSLERKGNSMILNLLGKGLRCPRVPGSIDKSIMLYPACQDQTLKFSDSISSSDLNQADVVDGNVYVSAYARTMELPPVQPDVFYIVSQAAALSASGRSDLLFPIGAKEGEKFIDCDGLGIAYSM